MLGKLRSGVRLSAVSYTRVEWDVCAFKYRPNRWAFALGNAISVRTLSQTGTVKLVPNVVAGCISHMHNFNFNRVEDGRRTLN